MRTFETTPRLIAEIFAETVGNSPDKIALSDSKVSLTFGELEAKLQEISKGINTLRAQNNFWGYVPLSVSRDVESAVLVLACHVYDIPYAPIDPDWKNERLAFVQETLGFPPFFLTTDDNSENLGGHLQELAAVRSTKALASLAQGKKEENYTPETDLGYAIFTSGTTGVPKCVAYGLEGKREKLETRIAFQSTPEHINPSEVSATLSYPIFFTAGISRLTGIVHGVSLRLVGPEEMTAERFVQLVRDLRPNRVSGPPSLLLLLANSELKLSEKPYLPSVKEVTWGGDAISYSTTNLLKKFFAPNTLMESTYGASEATSPLGHVFRLGDSPTSGPMPLGKLEPEDLDSLVPLDGLVNHFVLMLEEPMAVGYLNNPELTKERFVLNAVGKRQWYSGDVVEVDEAGFVWHKGRIDDLVKIRGKLTSPSEAMRALLSIDGIRDAVVLPIQNELDKQLVAHIEIDEQVAPSPTELRKELARRLPSHLVPHKIMRHEPIPKTSRGKPDREALLALEHKEFREKPPRVPLNQIEVLVLNACRIVLSIQELSVDDELVNFGMDSLAALQLQTILQEDLPGVTLDAIAQYPTIEKLSRFLVNSPEGELRQDGEYNTSGQLFPAFAFPGGGNRIAHFVNVASELGSDQPLRVLRYKDADLSAANTTIQGQAERALGEIIELNPTEPVKILGYSAGGLAAYELAKLCIERGIGADLTILDTSFALMGKRGFSFTQNIRANKASETKPGILQALVVGWKRQGAKRSLYVLLVEKPIEVIISRSIPRKVLRFLFGNLPENTWLAIRRRVTQLLLAQDRLEYKATPISQGQQELLRARYFHVPGNTTYENWSHLIPQIKYFPATGKHGDMLVPPNVRLLGEVLRGQWKAPDQIVSGKFTNSR